MKKNNPIDFHLVKLRFIDVLAKHSEFAQLSKQEQQTKAEMYLDEVFESIGQFVFPEQKQELLNMLLTQVIWGLQSIQQFQDNPEVEEIMINGFKNVFIKKRFTDQFELTDTLLNREELSVIIERLLEGSGRRVDRSTPMVDTRIQDGSRVNIVVEPISPDGPLITIRKFPEKVYTPEDLIKFKMFSQETGDFLAKAVKLRANILISGGTAVGKTTLTSALLSWVPSGEKGERVVLIEETAEISVPKQLNNVARLETRPANVDGKGELTIRDLVKNALRMRPDRIVVGEARGGEAYDLLQAMNTGHPGSMTTIHANSPESAIDRLEALVLLAGFQELPLSVIRSWIGRSIDMIIQLKRNEQQQRLVTEICTLTKDGKVEVLYNAMDKKINKKSFQTFITQLEKKQ